MLTPMDKHGQAAYYEDLLEKYGPNFRALDWNSPESQKLRYQILKEIFIYGKKASKLTVLDVGCGLGDLYGFFKTEGLLSRHKIKYLGFDISAKLLEAAKNKYPDAQFELKDILEEKTLPGFDYIFCSGIFNIRTTETEEHMEWVKESLLRMYDLANFGLAVSFLSEGSLPIANQEEMNTGRYFYFNPEEILNFCRFVCSRYILRHDYHPGDFTLYLFK